MSVKQKRKLPLIPSTQASDPMDLFVPKPGKDSLPVAGRVGADVKQQIQEVVQSGKLPFGTENDFVRAAVVFFLVEKIAPRMDARFQADVHLLSSHTRRGQRLRRLADLDFFCNSNKDTLLKLARAGMEADVFDHWMEMKKTSKAVGGLFHEKVKAWMAGDPQLLRIRTLVRGLAAAQGEKKEA